MIRHTEIISTHKTRVMARSNERRLTKILQSGWWDHKDLPGWARGVRVRKAGKFQFVVEATDWPGH